MYGVIMTLLKNGMVGGWGGVCASWQIFTVQILGETRLPLLFNSVSIVAFSAN